jgi:hypothetical protein
MSPRLKTKDIKEGISAGLQTGITSFGIPAIDILVSSKPEWQVPWFCIKGFLGATFNFQQVKISWFVDFLKEHPETFTKTILSDPKFQEGFVTTYTNYILQRNEEKLEIIKSIFLDFTTSQNKQDYELERYYDTVNRISIQAIELLRLITLIWPDFSSAISMRLRDMPRLSERISDFFQKEENIFQHTKIYGNLPDLVAELMSLGIIRYIGTKQMWEGGGPLEYALTDYGRSFLLFLLN